MGDMGDLWRAHKEQRKKEKEANIAEADREGWTIHSHYHWGMMLNGHKLDYWPSTRKWRWKGKNYHGTDQDCRRFIANRIEKEIDSKNS